MSGDCEELEPPMPLFWASSHIAQYHRYLEYRNPFESLAIDHR
ncbi:hypothetical protein L5515_003445 [Caenorhabditis briggsae]|uniref:Uncharacterized protein n=1 Tax=Caenorhabditis briggsae TaxID=6238 RepID=A0AAE9JC03_CAEBR|nr:hypothetical protein L5515_003445 [Caenorhabditis briggsae]